MRYDVAHEGLIADKYAVRQIEWDLHQDGGGNQYKDTLLPYGIIFRAFCLHH